jgi:Lipopolysaccharide-assembly
MRETVVPRLVTRVSLCVMAGLLAASCGYALAGRGTSLPDYIRTIGIPEFVNHSTMPDIDRVLTDQVRIEFGSHGRYRAQPEAEGADAVLTATITNVSLQPAAFTANAQAARYIVIVTASVEFRDTHADKVIWANPSVQYRDEYQVTDATSAADANAFFRNDTNALDRIAKAFARNVVTSVLDAF